MIDGKARTWRQWQQFKEKETEKKEIRKERAMIGRCAICMNGAFTLRIVNRELMRVCKHCADTIVI